jgi:hypothetical protein
MKRIQPSFFPRFAFLILISLSLTVRISVSPFFNPIPSATGFGIVARNEFPILATFTLNSIGNLDQEMMCIP